MFIMKTQSGKIADTSAGPLPNCNNNVLVLHSSKKHLLLFTLTNHLHHQCLSCLPPGDVWMFLTYKEFPPLPPSSDFYKLDGKSGLHCNLKQDSGIATMTHTDPCVHPIKILMPTSTNSSESNKFCYLLHDPS